jgi:hypothetical protein
VALHIVRACPTVRVRDSVDAGLQFAAARRPPNSALACMVPLAIATATLVVADVLGNQWSPP